MRTAHVRANGKKIAVAFVSPPKKTNKETQTRLLKLDRNETFIVEIAPQLELEAVEEEEEGFVKIDVAEIPDEDDNLHSYLDVDLEFLEDSEDGLVAARTAIPDDLVATKTPIPDSFVAPRTPSTDDLVAARTPIGADLVTARTPNKDDLVAARTPNKDDLVAARTPNKDDLVAARTPNKDDLVAARTPNKDDLVAARTPTPYPLLLLPPTDQTLSLSSAEGVISCYDDESVEEVRLEQDVVVDKDTVSELNICSDLPHEGTKNDQDDQSQVENIKVDRTNSSTDDIKTTESDDNKLCDFVDTTDISDLNSEVSDGDRDGSDSGFPCDSSR